MNFRTFRYRLVFRVLLLSTSLFFIVFLGLQPGYYISTLLLVIAAVIQVVLLVRFLEHSNVLLTRFLEAVRNSDFTVSFQNQDLGSNFAELNEAFSEVIEKFKEEREKKEESLRYLETVVQHIGIGLICFNSAGDVILINRAAKQLFQISALPKIEALENISGPLLKTVKNLSGGNRTLQRITFNNETLQLAIFATEFRMRDTSYKLVSFQNIHTELEEKEMESWQNITQVLAHEIMNSITPIASLSRTVHMLLDQQVEKKEIQLEPESLKDVKEALDTINKRSQGLMKFVNSYREFTQIPKPDYELIPVKQLLEHILHLMKGECENQGVKVNIEVVPENLNLSADPLLLEQVLINLTKNALGALEKVPDGCIAFQAKLNRMGHVEIQVKDNGPGIKKEVMDKIFIPFYSAASEKSTKGRGIGLSLSKEIMRNHGGTLTVNSLPDSGTVFTLRF